VGGQLLPGFFLNTWEWMWSFMTITQNCLIEPSACERIPVRVSVGRAGGADGVPPYDGPRYRTGCMTSTAQTGHEHLDLLHKLNAQIYKSFKYARREKPGVQLPHETLMFGRGSCRDFAVLMMEGVSRPKAKLHLVEA
jgi:hypothetical protein